jgi:hypothetical protein
MYKHKIKHYLVALLTIGLISCGSIGKPVDIVSGGPIITLKGETRDEKALINLNNAYQVAARAFVKESQPGGLLKPGDTKETIRKGLQQTLRAINAAYAAQQAANAATFNEQLSRGLEAYNGIRSLVPGVSLPNVTR